MQQAQELMDGFKVKMTAIAEEVLSDLYCNVSEYIESDHWSNFRTQIMDGMCNYQNRKIQGEYDFKRIRQAILVEHRSEIIPDLNKDMVEEIAAIKKQIQYLEEARQDRY